MCTQAEAGALSPHPAAARGFWGPCLEPRGLLPQGLRHPLPPRFWIWVPVATSPPCLLVSTGCRDTGHTVVPSGPHASLGQGNWTRGGGLGKVQCSWDRRPRELAGRMLRVCFWFCGLLNALQGRESVLTLKNLQALPGFVTRVSSRRADVEVASRGPLSDSPQGLELLGVREGVSSEPLVQPALPSVPGAPGSLRGQGPPG